MPRAVTDALDTWLHMELGVVTSHIRVGHFLDLLAEHGYTVERSVIASARSYTTIETATMERQPDPDPGLTERRIVAEDPTWVAPPDEEPPVRSLG